MRSYQMSRCRHLLIADHRCVNSDRARATTHRFACTGKRVPTRHKPKCEHDPCVGVCLFFESLCAHSFLSVQSCPTATIWAQIAPAVLQRGTLHLLVYENTFNIFHSSHSLFCLFLTASGTTESVCLAGIGGGASRRWPLTYLMIVWRQLPRKASLVQPMVFRKPCVVLPKHSEHMPLDAKGHRLAWKSTPSSVRRSSTSCGRGWRAQSNASTISLTPNSLNSLWNRSRELQRTLWTSWRLATVWDLVDWRWSGKFLIKPKQKRIGERFDEGGRPQHLLATRQSQQRHKLPHERHDLAYHSGRRLEMACYEKRCQKQQGQITSTTHDLHQHDCDNPTNNTSEQRTRQTPTTKTETTTRCS